MATKLATRSALAVMAAALAAVIMPHAPMAPSAWAEQRLVLVDGPREGQTIDFALTPYLREILDFWADACPANKAALRKSKQVGGSEVAIAAIGYSVDVEPCALFLIEPTEDNLSEFLQLKLQPSIDGSPALAAKVAGQTSRSNRGSTTFVKRFTGGSLLCGIASSTSALRGKTRRKVIKDEAAEYPEDLGDQGSPHDMIAGAYESFRAIGNWKELSISTPTLKGDYIDREFEAGDQRYWQMPCPGCGELFHFQFDRKRFRFNEAYPFEAHYVTGCCGSIVAAHERNDLVRRGRWIATAPAPGTHRSYHIDAFISPFVPWDVIAERCVKAQGKPAALKTFYNLTLGLPYEVKGDAPDYEVLLARVDREALRGHVPARGLILTAFADVQMRGIWLEIVAHAPNRESWCVDALYIEGDTAKAGGAAFAQLKRETLDREFPDAFGRPRRLDALAIDSGYRAHVVYAFVRSHQRPNSDTGRDLMLATKGLDGWSRPALGQPQLVDINLEGKRIAQGGKVWGIGTWPLKGQVYSDLALAMPDSMVAPDGYCHFGAWCDEVYFKQLTAEHLIDVLVKGRFAGRKWVQHGPDNHFLDCRVGNIALAEYLGLSSTAPEQWAALARARGLPPELSEVNLFTAAALAPVHDPAAAQAAIERSKDAERLAAGEPPVRSGWLPPRAGGWLRR